MSATTTTTHGATATVLTVPVRADLATVAPTYYPIAEQRRFGSIKAMCTRMRWPIAVVREYCVSAQIQRSGCVVIDELVLGEPEAQMRAVLVMQPGGAVILCVGMFAASSSDLASVQAVLADIAALPESKGLLLAVGEFRRNPAQVLQ